MSESRIPEEQYREMLIWTAQTCHNAYHGADVNWWDCRKDICDSTRRFLDCEYQVTPRRAAQWMHPTDDVIDELRRTPGHDVRRVGIREALTGQYSRVVDACSTIH